MGNKRSIGVTVLGIAILLFSPLGLIFYAPRAGMLSFYDTFAFKVTGEVDASHPFFYLYYSRILVLLLYFISGIGILQIKNWGRRLALYCLILLLIHTGMDFLTFIITVIREIREPKWLLQLYRGIDLVPFGIILISPIVILLLFLFYLTHPKVKEQFK